MSFCDPFYDPEDLSICAHAHTSMAKLNASLAPDGLYFPLWRDPSQTLGELYLQHRACSRSFRFGLVGDNVLGCRFRLLNGKTVELGGRVVKNVTGFDLVRFFAGSLGRFGHPETLVLRLRPLAEVREAVEIQGDFKSLERFRAGFLQSAWVHAVDALDFEVDAKATRLFVAWSCSKQEALLFKAAFRAQASGCQLASAELPKHPVSGCEIQIPLSQTLVAARRLARDSGSRASGFLGQGLVLLDSAPLPPLPPTPLEERFLALLDRLP